MCRKCENFVKFGIFEHENDFELCRTPEQMEDEQARKFLMKLKKNCLLSFQFNLQIHPPTKK